jgi:hypothetical protein
VSGAGNVDASFRLRSARGAVFAGVVESGYGRELVDRLPQLSRQDYRALRSPEAVWSRTPPPPR